MQQVLKDFLIDAMYQVLGWGKPRDGKLLLTRHAVTKMHEHQLDEDTLADVFRHGEEGTNGKMTRQYANYAVGLYYRYEAAENKFVIITCWKGVNRA
jgi:hypothetical protein